MLERINRNPSDDDLKELINLDSLGRNRDISDMLGLLQSINGGLSIFLDGDWGTGKTYFVRSLKIAIEMLNSVGPKSTNAPIPSCLNGINWRNDYLPIYFNAWRHDHWNDPLSAIALTLATETEDIRFEADASDSQTAKTAVLSLIETTINSVVPGLGTSIGETAKTLQAEDLLAAFKKRNQLRDKIVDAIDLLLAERANKLLLIVDELDRCEPQYACKLLEELKSLFELDNVVVIYSVNSKQLASIVEGQYGPNFDGQRYLSKFYDLSVPIRIVDMDTILSYRKIDPNYRSSAVIKAISEEHNMSLREVNRLIDYSNKYIMDLDNQYLCTEVVFCYSFMLILACGIRIMNPAGYGRLTGNGDEAVFTEEIMKSPILKKCFVENVKDNLTYDSSTRISNDADCLDKTIESVSTLAWSRDFSKKRAAYEYASPMMRTALIDYLENVSTHI